MSPKRKGGPRQARPKNKRRMQCVSQMPLKSDFVNIICARTCCNYPFYAHVLLMCLAWIRQLGRVFNRKNSHQRSEYAA